MSRDLAKLIGIPLGELRQFGVHKQLPFNFKPSVGLWIRRNDLPQWQRAVREMSA